MLKLNDVTWLYQHLPMRFTLDVARGERIAVLGPSGAGKSTLLNLIAGFLPPASGSLQINGETHHATPPAQCPVSMLFQENNLFNHLTIRQNISLGIHPGLKLSREQQHKVTAIAAQMGIDALLDRLEALRDKRGTDCMYVFPTRDNNAYSARGFKTLWQRCVVLALKEKVLSADDRFTFHDLRAYYATKHKKAHGRLPDMHANPAVTAAVYDRNTEVERDAN